ncbi:MAG: hypothetical protein ACK42A_01860 [Pyrinomonadaceae bacterium]|jgi:hypothetical protein
MSMPIVSIICGLLLEVIGFAGYAYGIMNHNASVTALIPAAFGTVFLVLGAFSRVKEELRKHLMHLAAGLALVGFLITAGRLLSKFGELTLSPAVISQAAMALVCLIFLILAIRSFIAARTA